ncbi:MAG TPA: hypothetical protein VFZ78_10285 [Flavisolibacter sp.]
MNNYASMSVDFERQKNTQASIITAAITGSLLLLFILMKLTVPVQDPPVMEEYVEVNLGTGDTGSGTDQPELPGEPAPAQQEAYVPPQPVQASNEVARDVETDDASPDAPAVIKPTVTRPNATTINRENRTTRTTNTAPQTVATPQPPRPRAVLGRMTGGNGTGGNGADTYRPGGNEGIAGGTGDQGRVGGSPTGRDYTGTPRNLGIRVVNIPSRSFEDDFTESGTVVLDIAVNDNGRLISASYQPAGSSITNRNQIEIAKRRAAELDFPKYEGGFRQRITMKFQVRS